MPRDTMEGPLYGDLGQMRLHWELNRPANTEAGGGHTDSGLARARAHERRARGTSTAHGKGSADERWAAALRRAAFVGDLPGVESLLAAMEEGEERTVDDVDGWDGRTALIEAARGGHGEVIDALHKAGADTDAQDQHGRTALRMSVDAKHQRALAALLDSGADVSLPDNVGVAPLAAAAYAGNLAGVEALIDRGGAAVDEACKNGRTAVLAAGQRNHHAIVKELVDRGAGLEARDRMEGQTLFHMACARNWPEKLINLMLSKGCDVTAEDGEGRTGWALAEKHKHYALLELLRKHGEHAEHGELNSEYRRRAGASSGSYLCNPAMLTLSYKAGHTVDLQGELHRNWVKPAGTIDTLFKM